MREGERERRTEAPAVLALVSARPLMKSMLCKWAGPRHFGRNALHILFQIGIAKLVKCPWP